MLVSNNALPITGIGKTCARYFASLDLTGLHYYFTAFTCKNIDVRHYLKLKRQRQG